MRILLVLLLALFTACSLALQQPTSYCKCICFQNSTIIPLNSPPSTSPSPSTSPRSVNSLSPRDEEDGKKEEHHKRLSCTDCNRAFCLDYNLPICKNAKEEDVFAQCFRTPPLSLLSLPLPDDFPGAALLTLHHDSPNPISLPLRPTPLEIICGGVTYDSSERDSLKDRTIVTIFMIATVGLLAWALLKPFIVKSGVMDVVQQYTPVRSGLSSDGGDVGNEGLDGRLPMRNDRTDVGTSGFGSGGATISGSRPGRVDGGRASVSRQGGLNS